MTLVVESYYGYNCFFYISGRGDSGQLGLGDCDYVLKFSKKSNNLAEPNLRSYPGSYVLNAHLYSIVAKSYSRLKHSRSYMLSHWVFVLMSI